MYECIFDAQGYILETNGLKGKLQRLRIDRSVGSVYRRVIINTSEIVVVGAVKTRVRKKKRELVLQNIIIMYARRGTEMESNERHFFPNVENNNKKTSEKRLGGGI